MPIAAVNAASTAVESKSWANTVGAIRTVVQINQRPEIRTAANFG